MRSSCWPPTAPVTSRQVHLYRGHWFDALEVYWKDLHGRGRSPTRDYGTSDTAPVAWGATATAAWSPPMSSCRRAKPARSASRISWYAPNFRKYWITPVWHFRQASGRVRAVEELVCDRMDRRRARSPREVLARWDELRDETLRFRDALYGSTLPHAVLDAAAANLSILKSPTTLRLEDGTFYGWEGCHPTAGCCEGSCTHVWNYQQALPFLFPALERSMREADYAYNMNDAGGMSFRLSLPLGTHYTTERPCADGQFGNILKLYRDWKLSGDMDWLRRLWPARQAEHRICLEPGQSGPLGPRADRCPVGPAAPHPGHGAVRPELLADRLLSRRAEGRRGDGRQRSATSETADAVSRRYIERGRAWVDDNLFNGEYFVQQVDLRRPLGAASLHARPRWPRAAGRRGGAALLEPGAQAAQISARRWLPDRPGARPMARAALWPWRRPRSASKVATSLQCDLPVQLQATAGRHRTIRAASSAWTTKSGTRHRELAGGRRASRRCPCPTPRRRCTAWSTPSARC